MTDHISIGKIGEDIACRFLKEKKHKILKRNVATKFGELDIISRAPDKTLVFVEAKTLRQLAERSKGALMPEDNLTYSKLKKTRRIAEWYANQPSYWQKKDNASIDDAHGYRIDLVAILLPSEMFQISPTTITAELLTNIYKDCVINHYENVA